MTKTERLDELKTKLNIELAETVLEQEITIGRLRKRISKLVQQRDFLKNEKDFFEAVVKHYPYSIKSYEEKLKIQDDLNRYREIKITYYLLLRENERLNAELEKLKAGV